MFYFTQFEGFQMQAAQARRAHSLVDSTPKAIGDGDGLFKDLLQHKVFKIALFDGGNIPINHADLRFHAGFAQGGDLKTVLAHHTELGILQIDYPLGVDHDGAYIAGDKVFIIVDSDDQGTALAHGDQLIRFFLTDHHQAVGAFH